ncbi:MAG TPA: hypothetical protein VM535_00940 [Candidatus Saccharimonadales bacterium]|nr:hypothetical protein [Candidatus Saccharimonadales bacterium]
MKQLEKLKFNREQLVVWWQKVRRYTLPIFLAFVGLIYIFVLFRIHSLTTAQPSESAVNSQVKAAQIPHIEKSVLQQLQSLQDNSVNVQALFNQARSNPFQ